MNLLGGLKVTEKNAQGQENIEKKNQQGHFILLPVLTENLRVHDHGVFMYVFCSVISLEIQVE